MEAKTYTVINPGNTVASGNTVYFYESGTNQTILAAVYGSNVQSNPLTQPLLTDSNGQVSAYIPNGVYDIKLVQTSGLVQLIQDVLYNDPADSTFELNTVVNEGTGVGIFDKIVGSSINLKSLVAGGNVQLADIGNGNIVISSNPGAISGITAGQNIQVSINSGVATISSPNGGTVTGGSSDGSGVSLYNPVSSTPTNLHIKSLIGGSNVAVTDNGSGGVVISTVIPGGTVTGGFSEGSGVAVFDAPHSTSSQLAFRTLAAGANISITQQNDGTLTVASVAGTGTVTEAINEGAGVPVFDYENSTATTLAFKSIAAGSNVEISDSGNGTIFVNSTSTGGTVVGAVSVGSGDPLYDSSLSDASTIAIKSIATSGIVTHTDANGLVTISAQAIQSGVSEGSGVSVLDSTNSTSSQLKFKSIAAGENVSVVDNGSGTITIASSNPGGTVVGAETRGTGVAVWDFSATTAEVLAFKTLHGSSNLNVVDDGEGNITLSALTGGSVLGGESVGTGNAIYDAAASSSSTIAIKSVAAGSNVTIVDNGSGTLTFNSTASGSLTGAENVGSGTGLFDSASSSSSTLAFKSIAAGANVTVTDNGSGTVTVASIASGSGTVSTGSSEGTGVPVFDSASSTSSNLAFRSIKQGTWTSVTNDGSGDVVIDVPDVTVITMASEGTGISILDAASTPTNILLKSVLGGSGISVIDDGIGDIVINNTLVPLAQTDLPHGYNLIKKGIVINTGSSGSWNENRVEGPSVFWDPQAGLYKMMYNGYSGAVGSPNVNSIGYSTSPDLQTWTPFTSNPIFQASGTTGAPDQGAVGGPFVFYNDGTYYMYYIGYTETGFEAGTKSLCLATSTDFITWTRHGAIISPTGSGWRSVAIWHPCVVQRNQTYYLFFNAGDGGNSGAHESIGYATSSDLITWTVDDINSPILNNGTSGAFDADRVNDPYVYRVGNTWYMAYSGVNSTGAIAGCGIAYTSNDAFPLGWQKFSGNPILNPGLSGSFDAEDCGRPGIFMTPDRLYHWYTAQSGGSPDLITIALAVDDTLKVSTTAVNGASSYIGARAYTIGTQTIPSNASTAITYGINEWDTSSIHSTNTNTSRFTIPISGRWRFTYNTFFSPTSGTIYLFLRKNGGTDADDIIGSATTCGNTGATSATVVETFTAGDYVEAYVFMSNGGTVGSAFSSPASCSSMEAQFLDVGIPSQTVRIVTTTTDTVLISDANNTVVYNSASAIAATLPDNATTAGLTVGFTVDYAIINTGQVTFAVQGSDVLIFYSPTSAASPVTIAKGVTGTARILSIDGSNNRTWIVSGNFV